VYSIDSVGIFRINHIYFGCLYMSNLMRSTVCTIKYAKIYCIEFNYIEHDYVRMIHHKLKYKNTLWQYIAPYTNVKTELYYVLTTGLYHLTAENITTIE
jgi:hypothetical protein